FFTCAGSISVRIEVIGHVTKNLSAIGIASGPIITALIRVRLVRMIKVEMCGMREHHAVTCVRQSVGTISNTPLPDVVPGIRDDLLIGKLAAVKGVIGVIHQAVFPSRQRKSALLGKLGYLAHKVGFKIGNA